MKSLLHHIEQNRSLFNLPDGNIFLELHAPWRLSRTGRCSYKVRLDDNPKYSLVIQDGLTLSGVEAKQNPYEPTFREFVDSILPVRRGSFLVEGITYFWSEYVEGTSLGEIIRNDRGNSERWSLLLNAGHMIHNLQHEHLATSSSFIDDLMTLCEHQISDDMLFSSLKNTVTPAIAALSQWDKGLCAWSHGDLWPEDVLLDKRGKLHVLDWEWALGSAPAGCDLIDFYVSSAEHILNMDTEKAWRALFANHIPQLQQLRNQLIAFWNALSFEREDIKNVVLYSLVRSCGRIVAQEGHEGFSHINAYLNVISDVLNRWSALFALTGAPEPAYVTAAVSEASLKEMHGEPLKISVITPTQNRAKFLKRAIQSFVKQDFSEETYEIIIVDNGSTDTTKQVVEEVIPGENKHSIRYVHEPEPGLLSGRHRGALEAKGDILVFTDDDIEANPKWLSSIASCFENPDVHLAGGPSLPKFETIPPQWILPYFQIDGRRLTCGSLSLLDLGDRIMEIDPVYIWGLNFAIRKRTLFNVGGFHPDIVPKHLQRLQGDGETGLSLKMKARGYKALYHAGAMVYHVIPSSRLTPEYFEKRFYFQGVCDSYTAIRRQGSADSVEDQKYDPLDKRIPRPDNAAFRKIYTRIHRAYIQGFNFHLNSVRKSPELLKWVLKEDYLDYKLPKI